MDIKLIGALIAVFNLIVNVLVMPFLFVNGVILAILGIFNTFLFVYFSTKVIETRLKWEMERRPFGAHDWMRTALFLGLLCVVSSVGGFVIWGMMELILNMSIPFTGMTLGELVFEGE
jgi:O-antigen/teichoic acid export membrane protein